MVTRIVRVVLLMVLVGLIVVQPASAEDPFPNLKFPWNSATSKVWSTGLHESSASGYCTTQYGWGQTSALDFAGGFDALAAASGVVQAGTNSGSRFCGAQSVRIQHNSTWATEYCHLATRNNELLGKWVTQGTKIGSTGSCAVCSGNHLHMTLLKNGQPETWHGKVMDGWQFFATLDRATQLPLYGEGTATQVGWRTSKSYGVLTDGFCGSKNVYAWVSHEYHTKVTAGSVLVITDPWAAFPNTRHANASFTSTNVRR